MKKGKEYVEYCRVKFFATSYEQVVESSLVKVGNFKDESLEEQVWEPAYEQIWVDDSAVAELTKYIAINEDEEEFEVADLEAFCKENNLLLESMEAILEGKQKTHKKWTIRKVYEL